MPIQINQQLIDDLVQRQIRQNEQKQQEAQQPAEGHDIDPSLLAVLGGVADGASTYNFLRQGSGVEGNKMYGSLNGSPLKTGLSVAATGLAGVGIAKLLAKKFPKIANAMLANQAATQIGYAGKNISPDMLNGHRTSSSTESYNNSVTQAIRRSHEK